jgi:hypothetical protein
MSYPRCPNCNTVHTSNYRYCSTCGNDLEEIILSFKEKKLPISYNNGNNHIDKKKVLIRNEAEERRQAVLQIKEKKRERERIEKAEIQRKRDKYLQSLDRKRIPTLKQKRLRYIPPIVTFALMMGALALLNTDIYGDVFIAVFTIMIVGPILLVLSFIPLSRAVALIRSDGLTASLRKAPKPPKDELTQCLECADCLCWM